jgi:hypothetical protein
MASPFSAADVMDQSAILLNDPVKALFSYEAQLPFLRRANEFLENLMISNGASVQRQAGTVLTVLPSTINIDLSQNINYPSDMLLPIRCLEAESASGLFSQMTEKDWEPELNVTSSISMWTYRNNRIYTPGVTTTRYMKIDYWRQLSVVTSEGDNQEFVASKTYLAAKTAEMCARYIGQNKDIADDLLTVEVLPAQLLLEGIYIKNSQGVRTRRMRFTRPRTYYSR